MSVDLTRELDRAKAKAFLDSNSAFLGPILVGLRFAWDKTVETACTDGIDLKWNPDWFISLQPPARVTVLMHEIWHVARLHLIRRNGRDPLWWNYACDIWINNQLERDKFSFKGIENCWKDQQYHGKTEEEIYAAIYDPQSPPPPPASGSFGEDGGAGDMQESPGGVTDAQREEILSTVTQAMHQAGISGNPGSMPGDTERLITQFLKPVVPWQSLLQRFFNDMQDEDYSWSRPNRRFDDIYLPHRFLDDGKLEHLAYYLDVSGSITQQDLLRFNSEVKHVWDHYQPQKMSLIQFDTRISHVEEIEEGHRLDEVKIKGGGGTCLKPVREHIIKNRPTAAIIFSDMEVAPMEKLPFDIPVIWVVLGGRSSHKPSFGEVIIIPQGSVPL
ncbi:hypothetical protein JJJA_0035 [Achromobacter phage JWDelta]|uniref:Metallopeptidase domain protein n=1 Tax=Achromobacter phage JWDelta TaxID=1416008 RepID=V9SI46_9CAUD|nr:hypothetical protein JJJA_0035 [Achromobacter phage JWDelta]